MACRISGRRRVGQAAQHLERLLTLVRGDLVAQRAGLFSRPAEIVAT